ncbi:MAG: hypothetical protein Q8L64_06085 [bacterium]|nr:hypothetical protein [bacterium]
MFLNKVTRARLRTTRIRILEELCGIEVENSFQDSICCDMSIPQQDWPFSMVAKTTDGFTLSICISEWNMPVQINPKASIPIMSVIGSWNRKCVFTSLIQDINTILSFPIETAK